MTEQVIGVDGVSLCVDTFGSTDNPAVVLIAGGGQSMVWWDDDLCARLAAAGRHVVRYDHRDTGRSTATPAGAPTYTSQDLATDPVRIMDALGLDRAHVVGMSMGGGIAQRLAVTHPDRVRTLTLIASSPASRDGEDAELPGPEPRITATWTDPDPEPDWADRASVVDYRIDAERPYAGGLGFDESRVRRLATAEVDRTQDMAASITNHFVVAGDGWPADKRLADIAAPTLVLHGTTDPMFPVQHGEALARMIPGARLVRLEGMGHEQPPPALWDVALPALVEHTAMR